MQMHIVLLFVVILSFHGANGSTPRPEASTTRAHPTQPPTKKPTTKAPTATKEITISLPNQITGSDNNQYFHTRKELNVEIKKITKTTGPVPSGKVTYYKDGVKLGTKILTGGKTKYTISNLPNQFQGEHSIKIEYSGDKVYKQKTTTFKLFFFTIPRNGNYLINGNQSIPENTVTFWNPTKGVWNSQNKLPTNIDFYGWAKPTPKYDCKTKFNVRVSPNKRQLYEFTGVIAVKTIGTSGIASSSKIQEIVVVDTRDSAEGTGRVVTSFCASAV